MESPSRKQAHRTESDEIGERIDDRLGRPTTKMDLDDEFGRESVGGEFLQQGSSNPYGLQHKERSSENEQSLSGNRHDIK